MTYECRFTCQPSVARNVGRTAARMTNDGYRYDNGDNLGEVAPITNEQAAKVRELVRRHARDQADWALLTEALGVSA